MATVRDEKRPRDLTSPGAMAGTSVEGTRTMNATQSTPRRRPGTSHSRYHQLLEQGYEPFCIYCNWPLVCCDDVPLGHAQPVITRGVMTQPVSGRMWNLDHFIPKVLGGPDTLDNLVPCCSPCNTFKGGKLPQVAFPDLFR